jgi:hypothetical protein
MRASAVDAIFDGWIRNGRPIVASLGRRCVLPRRVGEAALTGAEQGEDQHGQDNCTQPGGTFRHAPHPQASTRSTQDQPDQAGEDTMSAIKSYASIVP